MNIQTGGESGDQKNNYNFMDIDYDDMCNGNGEWKNIQPVLRSSLFSQAQDVLQLKQHLVEFAKKIQAVEKQNSDLQQQLIAKTQQFDDKLRKIEDHYKEQNQQLSKRIDELEEKVLEQQYQATQATQKSANEMDRIKQSQEQLNNQIIQKQTQMEEILTKFMDQQELFNKQVNSTLKTTVTQNEVKALANKFVDKQEMEQLKQKSVDLERNNQSLQNQLNSQRSHQETQLHSLNELKTEIQQTFNDDQLVKLIQDKMSDYATKSVVQQIGKKINEKITLLQETQRDQVQQVQQNVVQQTDDNKQLIFDMQQKMSQLSANINSKLLDLNKLQHFDKQLKQFEVQLAQKLDTNYLSQLNRQVVTQDVLDQEIQNLLSTCQKQIRNEVENFTDNSLYRTVKSIIKAELDIVSTKNQQAMDNTLAGMQEKLMRKIVAEVSPEEQLKHIDQQCEDIRQLINMVANDVDFKIQKNHEEVGNQLQNEVAIIKGSLNAMHNALATQNDVFTCRLKDYDVLLQSSSFAINLPTARWTWRTKRLSSQQAIIWSAEEANTLPSNFIWEKGKSSILIVSAGCYKVEFAVFARKRPTVQIVVNNEPILSAMSGGVAPALYTAPKGPAGGCYYAQSHIDYLYLSQNTVLQLMIGSEFSSCLSGYLVIQKQW